ncbi:MAG TPA: amidohydrolase [Vicinamibacteria bacterium]|nr:amidohydrolase [Vicinamibacteria bacterium]
MPLSLLLLSTVVAAPFAIASTMAKLPAQHAPPDIVLVNGKIITVDERFTIAEAIAVTGERILAVGTDEEITRLAGQGTRWIDLEGKAVIPGLIDNHMHLLRAGLTWRREVRWDGVGSRKQALAMLRARTNDAGPDEWVFNLGGWTRDQFADDASSFTRDELDGVAPDHPVLLQAAYYETYLNSRAIESLRLEERDEPWIGRDPTGRPTGVIEEPGVGTIAAELPVLDPPADEVEASTMSMFRDLNRAGLTSVGSAGCEPELIERYRAWADEGRLSLRVFCITSFPAGTPQEVDDVLTRIAAMKLFEGDHDIDWIAYGEGVYRPLHDPMFLLESDPTPDELAQWRRLTTEVARAGLPLHVHANLKTTIGAFLDQIERIHREYPIDRLRWALAHFNEPSSSQLERMKSLGMHAAVHPWAVINGGIQHRVYGEAAHEMPPLRMIQDSGIAWGLGSDGSRANQVLPMVTLGWAVTGRMVGGNRVLRQTISREDALIAHTRGSAHLVFQEKNLGTIEAGKLADLVVLDRDYLTVDADQIKDTTSVLTMVGGRIVYSSVASPVSR